MKRPRYPVVTLIALGVLVMACTAAESVIWSIGGPQIAIYGMETEISPISTKGSALPDSATENCVVPQHGYAWSYEDFRSSSGTGGVTCNAAFTIRNTGREPLYVLMFTAWDNNAIQDRRWQKFQLQPGGQREEDVSRTIYADGVVTYSRVESILVVRDTPECAGLLSTENQPAWESQAVQINPLACP